MFCNRNPSTALFPQTGRKKRRLEDIEDAGDLRLVLMSSSTVSQKLRFVGSGGRGGGREMVVQGG